MFLLFFFTQIFFTLAFAAPEIFFDTIVGGRKTFDKKVTDLEANVAVDELSGLTTNTTWGRSNYTITSSNNQTRFISNYLQSAPSLSSAIPTQTTGQSINMTSDGTQGSGLTFTFNSSINFLAIELGDWGTCCYPSAMLLQFDNEAPITVASVNSINEIPEKNSFNTYTLIGAISGLDYFNTVQIFGLASGDVLYAGGTIRYGRVDIEKFAQSILKKEAVSEDRRRAFSENRERTNAIRNLAKELLKPAVSQATREKAFSIDTEVQPITTVPILHNIISSKANIVNFNQEANMLSLLACKNNPQQRTNLENLKHVSLSQFTEKTPLPHNDKHIENYRLWAQPFGMVLKNTDTSPGIDKKSGGVIFGVDKKIGKDFYTGIIAGTSTGGYDQKENLGKGQDNTFYGGLYGLYTPKNELHFDASFIFGLSKHKQERNMPLLGRKAYSNFKSTTFSGRVRAGYPIKKNIEIFLAAGASYFNLKSHKEYGASAFNLNIPQSENTTFSLELGTQFSGKLSNTLEALAQISALGQIPHKKTMHRQLSFVGETTTFFDRQTTRKKIYAVLTIGLSKKLHNNFELFTFIKGHMKKKEHNTEFILKISKKF